MTTKHRSRTSDGIKHELAEDGLGPNTRDKRPAKKAKLLDDSDSASDDEGGVSLKVNEEYAKRFEYNKKREEKQRLEEKYGNGAGNAEDYESEEDSEDDVDEDDDGEILTEALDADIMATLRAIRSKDPRVYDPKVTFYKPVDENGEEGTGISKQEKGMTLKEYHTKNLLEGKFAVDEDEEAPPKSYAQEQEEVRRNLVQQMHSAADAEGEEYDFLVRKSRPEPKSGTQRKQRVVLTENDVAKAEKDPETFLSNFMAAQAWKPTDGAHWRPVESDDEEEEARADDFENAYNLYFEDTSAANEKLVTYARDAVASTSVRREDPNGRRKARELARAKREAERKQKEEELARLRKLKIDEVEGKVKRIRKTAGMSGKQFNIDEWRDVLDADWSDDQWDEEMRKRFGESYYNADEGEADSATEEDAGKKTKKKPKKPKWDDDIDIKDLIPEFEEEEMKPPFSLSSSDEADPPTEIEARNDEEEEEGRASTKSSKKRKQEHADAKRDARRERRIIESLVDSNLEYEATLATKSQGPTTFRYRETTPTTFGLTSRDILLASDAQLNEFAGLKKLAAFRDPDKKKKDKKYLSKKARLRQWRMETFGDEEGPKGGFELLLGDAGTVNGGKRLADGEADVRGVENKKKRKRSRKAKDKLAEGPV